MYANEGAGSRHMSHMKDQDQGVDFVWGGRSGGAGPDVLLMSWVQSCQKTIATVGQAHAQAGEQEGQLAAIPEEGRHFSTELCPPYLSENGPARRQRTMGPTVSSSRMSSRRLADSLLTWGHVFTSCPDLWVLPASLCPHWGHHTWPQSCCSSHSRPPVRAQSIRYCWSWLTSMKRLALVK